MPMLSVDRAAQASEFTEESFWQNGSEVNRRFAERWNAVMPEDKPAPNMEHFLEFMARDLKASREVSVATAEDHETQLGGDREVKIERSETHTELNSAYLDTRTIIESIYGRPAALKMGFSYPRSENPYRFGRQTATVIRAFQALPQEEPIPAPEGKEQLALTPGAILAVLEPPFKRFKVLLKNNLKEVRRSQKSQVAKQEAYDTQVKRYSTHSKCGEMVYRMVGLERFADQIKPSTRRPGMREVDVEGTENEAPTPPAGSTDTPAPAADASAGQETP